jgi:hypothetical protein
VQINNASAANIASASPSLAKIESSSLRSQVEQYLTGPDKADRSKTWAVHKADGFADFLAQPDFREQYDKYVSGISTDDSVWSKWPADKRRAFGDATSPIVHERIAREMARHVALVRASNEAIAKAGPAGYPSIGDARSILAASGFSQGRPFNAQELREPFEHMANSGLVRALESVDRQEQAGDKTLSWETTFRGFVTSLDTHFNIMRRAYEAHKQDTTEIHKRYDEVLGELYDYAVERDRQKTAQVAA